jgi:hypothetical protein
MMKNMLVVACIVGSASLAHAGGQQGTIGVGAEFQINGIGGASMNYDAGQFHVGGFFGFQDPPGGDNTEYEIGGRFFWHVHKSAMADFGIGGGLGIESVPPGGAGGDRQTGLWLEPSFQIRAFIASNVALSFTAGIVIGAVDADTKAITGTPTGGAGIHYYFF